MAKHYRISLLGKLRLSAIVAFITIIRCLNSSENVHFDDLKLKDAEVLSAEANARILEDTTTLSRTVNSRLYSPSENSLSKPSVTWADFLLLPKEKLRTAVQIRPNSPIIQRNVCPLAISSNLSLKLGGADYDWCKWALSETGAKVKVGIDFGVLSVIEEEKFIVLGCKNIVKQQSFSCDDERGDGFIRAWKNGEVPDLCERSAESKVECFDSMEGSRYCKFENAMMNFKRMRQKVRADGTPSRTWEQGFLSTSCGEMGKENIGYFQVYKPDIAGSSDAVCDFVFNETVLAYSHDNIKSFSHIFSDYLNIQSMLMLSGAAAHTHDVTLLNIDSFRMQPFYGDQANAYFNHYSRTFRRIVKAVDFGPTSTVCFKNLIMQPKPEVPFTRDGWRHSLRCPLVGPSSLYQRWNSLMRSNLRYDDSTLQANKVFTILLIKKASRLGSRKGTKKDIHRGVSQKTQSSHHMGEFDRSPSAAGVSNSEEVEGVLSDLSKVLSTSYVDVTFKVVVQDFDVLTFDEQVALVMQSSILIGMHGTGIALSMHMPVGTKYCCGVVEIFPGEKDTNSSVTAASGNQSRVLVQGGGGGDKKEEREKGRVRESKFRDHKGHANMALRMGLKYVRMDLLEVSKKSKGSWKRASASMKMTVNAITTAVNSVTQKQMVVDADTVKGAVTSSSRNRRTPSRSRSLSAHTLTSTGTQSIVSASNHTAQGTKVSTSSLRRVVLDMVTSILKTPSCVLSDALRPYDIKNY